MQNTFHREEIWHNYDSFKLKLNAFQIVALFSIILSSLSFKAENTTNYFYRYSSNIGILLRTGYIESQVVLYYCNSISSVTHIKKLYSNDNILRVFDKVLLVRAFQPNDYVYKFVRCIIYSKNSTLFILFKIFRCLIFGSVVICFIKNNYS